MRGAVLLDLRARQWPQAWPSGRSAQERALAVVVKTAKFVLAFDRSALWGDPDPVPVLECDAHHCRGLGFGLTTVSRKIEMRRYSATLNSHNPFFSAF
jgi:hypothetical protein